MKKYRAVSTRKGGSTNETADSGSRRVTDLKKNGGLSKGGGGGGGRGKQGGRGWILQQLVTLVENKGRGRADMLVTVWGGKKNVKVVNRKENNGYG